MILLVTFAGIAHGFSLEKAAFYVFFLDGDFSGIERWDIVGLFLFF